MSVCTALSSFSSPRLQYFKESPLSRPDQVFTRPAPARLFPALVFRAPPPLPPPQARRPSVVVPVVLLCSASGAVYCVNQVLAHPPPASTPEVLAVPPSRRPEGSALVLLQAHSRKASLGAPAPGPAENGRRTDGERTLKGRGAMQRPVPPGLVPASTSLFYRISPHRASQHWTSAPAVVIVQFLCAGMSFPIFSSCRSPSC